MDLININGKWFGNSIELRTLGNIIGSNSMKKNTILSLSSGIFFAVSLVHLVRFFSGGELSIFNYQLPQIASILAAIITALLGWQLHSLRD
ncbi:uncharacterized protein METZ01_LOCUS70049 [marine metagenome]|uniref:Uncharacterized protein n=1 Tax=marine metagenome TaxID=408172 RepID=A0A381TMB0_9ZZZZ